jgi:hypothetical protein
MSDRAWGIYLMVLLLVGGVGTYTVFAVAAKLLARREERQRDQKPVVHEQTRRYLQ